jgi:ABC-type glutathione transport system ATPase component
MMRPTGKDLEREQKTSEPPAARQPPEQVPGLRIVSGADGQLYIAVDPAADTPDAKPQEFVITEEDYIDFLAKISSRPKSQTQREALENVIKWLRQDPRRPLLLPLVGESGHGKSDLARKLLHRAGAAPENKKAGAVDAEVELAKRIVDVIGMPRATKWIQTRIPALKGRTPYSVMGSEEGRAEVAAVLDHIEHGVF